MRLPTPAHHTPLLLLILIGATASSSLAQTPPDRTIEFAGRTWNIKNTDYLIGPGPSYFSNSEQSVWLDPQGHLHLKLRNINGTWHSAQVTLPVSLGYGTYRYQIASNPDLFDLNVVVGLYVYEDDFNEFDIELARFSDPTTLAGQFVVQPGDRSGNKQKFPLTLTGINPLSTHQITWQSDSLTFQSYRGHTPSLQAQNDLIHQWTYTGNDTPQAEGLGTPRINLWQFKNRPPSDGNDVELIITDFTFTPTSQNPEPTTLATLTAATTLLLTRRHPKRTPQPAQD